MKTRILPLKLIELGMFIFTIFIIFYNELLPDSLVSNIDELGLGKIAFSGMAVLVSTYFFIGRKEKPYLKTKFSTENTIVSIITVLLIGILFFVMQNDIENTLISISK